MLYPLSYGGAGPSVPNARQAPDGSRPSGELGVQAQPVAVGVLEVDVVHGSRHVLHGADGDTQRLETIPLRADVGHPEAQDGFGT